MAYEKREQEFAARCAEAVNPMNFSTKIFCEALGRQHRTLQQNFTRVCLAWIKYLASLEEGEYDLRNEASVKTSRNILEKVGEYNLNLPLI